MLKLKAYAKINWSLDITGVRQDGYHELDMLMQKISVYDTLILEEAKKLTLDGTTPESGLAGQGMESAPVSFGDQNIVMKAARALQAETGCSSGAAMHLEKQIPSGAGLGGGSADAAAALAGLNQLWNLQLSQERLKQIGLKLGADVPYMISGGLCRVRGIGEQLEPLQGGPRLNLVLCKPCAGLNTGAVYHAWDDQKVQAERPQTEAAISALLAGDLHRLDKSAQNVLQPVSENACPQIVRAQELLKQEGSLFTRMTGSGCVVFGVFEDVFSAAGAVKTLRQVFDRDPLCWVSWAQTITR